MMKKIRYCAAALALGMMGGCSSDELVNGTDSGVVSPQDGVYFAVNITMPSVDGATRSFTDKPDGSNSGVEIGSDAENKVENAIIVLASTKDNSNTFIAAGELVSGSLTEITSKKGTYTSTSKFTKTKIKEYYDNTDIFSPEVNVFVFCNPTPSLVRMIENLKIGDKEWFDAVGTYAVGTSSMDDCVWKDNYFAMSNSAIATRSLPPTFNEWNNYSSESSPFDLSGMNQAGRPDQIDNLTDRGNIKVERMSARFDFRDGSVDGADNPELNGIGDNTYEVVLDMPDADGVAKSLVNVQLGKMALVNMNKNFYYLPRVSPEGKGNNITLCGPELPWYTNASGEPINGTAGNYVVDADWEWKSGEARTGFSNYFNYPFLDEEGNVDNTDMGNDRWYSNLISNVLSGEDDNNDSWNNDNSKGDYKVWTYSTENTIPDPVSNQTNGISTGVVFKGKMLATQYLAGMAANDEWRKALNDALSINGPEDYQVHGPSKDPILYSFGGHLYVTWDNIRRAALAAAITKMTANANGTFTCEINRTNSLYRAVFGNGGFGTISFSFVNDAAKNYGLMTPGDNHITDPQNGTLGEDTSCANYAWNAWFNAGKPFQEDPANLYSAMKKAVTGAKITIYQSSYDKDLGGWGYYCYYYYWNRHNNNGQDGVMGPMEFAVVRNNVYKLAVTRIARLGHPRISENDPDKPTPDTPDEKGDVYLKVTCETLPWVVRLNDITFD